MKVFKRICLLLLLLYGPLLPVLAAKGSKETGGGLPPEHLDYAEGLKQASSKDKNLLCIVLEPKINLQNLAGLFLPRLLLFDPLTRFGPEAVQCPTCLRQTMARDEWPKGHYTVCIYRRVHDLPFPLFVTAPRYRCSVCKSRARAYHCSLSKLARSRCPIFLTHGGGLSEVVMEALVHMVKDGSSFRGVADYFGTVYRCRFEDIVRKYLLEGGPFAAQRTAAQADQYKFLARPPSKDYIAYCFTLWVDNNRPFFIAQMKQLGATSLSIDHTYKVCKRFLRKRADGKRVPFFKALFVGMNKDGYCIDYNLCKDETHQDITSFMTELKTGPTSK